MHEGICLGASRFESAPYEESILAKLPPPPPATSVSISSDFGTYLKRAVGWANIPQATIKCSPYRQSVSECFAQYGDLLTARFLFRVGAATKPLVIVLHGHVSTANKVMGFEPADYMRAVGRVLSERGYSVAALDLTSNANTSSELNGQLVLHGFQIYGLWSRFVCDVAGYFSGRKIVVYGLSNGGLVADHVSILCDLPDIDAVFVDDTLTDWRALATRHPSIHAVQNYALHYLAPLHYDASYLNFIVASRYRKIYTRDEAFLPPSFPNSCILPRASNDFVLWAPLRVRHHVAQLELLEEFLSTGHIRESKVISRDCIRDALVARTTTSVEAIPSANSAGPKTPIHPAASETVDEAHRGIAR